MYIQDTMTYPVTKAPTITVDNSVDYVSPLPSPLVNVDFVNTNQKKTFAQADNFIIQSVAIILPEFYTVWKDPGIFLQNLLPSIAVILRGVSGTTYQISVLGSYAAIRVPMENYETACNVFVDVTALGVNEAFTLRSVGIYDCPVSMRLSPAIFNGKEFAIVPYMKVLHNKPLT